MIFFSLFVRESKKTERKKNEKKSTFTQQPSLFIFAQVLSKHKNNEFLSILSCVFENKDYFAGNEGEASRQA